VDTYRSSRIYLVQLIQKTQKILRNHFLYGQLSKIVCNINLSTNFQFESEFHSAKSVKSQIRNERFFCILCPVVTVA
jgi:hypothetical protein